MKILSTKSLNSIQKKLFSELNSELTTYDAIKINRLNFDTNIIATNAIITSQNAAQIIIDEKILVKYCFCVGEKTKTLLEANGQMVHVYKKNSLELAKYIQKKHADDNFWYFCGSRRLNDLPNHLNTFNIAFKEVHVYETSLNIKSFNKTFDGVLFYSPSGVESFTQKNDLLNSTAYCIGKTTAEAAKKHTKAIKIADNPSIESVIDLVVKHLKKNDKKRLIS